MSKSYNILTIQQYLADELSPNEMYRLEREALEDPLLQDAIDGYASPESINHRQLSFLQKRLENRIAEQREERNILHFTWQRLAIASVAGTLLIVIGILFWLMNAPMKNPPKDPNIKEVEVTLTSPVSASLEKGNIAPLNGWNNYNRYLSINHQGELSGQEVAVSFQISSGRPINISIISTRSDKVAAEAVRLIQEGPKWKGKSGKIKMSF